MCGDTETTAKKEKESFLLCGKQYVSLYIDEKCCIYVLKKKKEHSLFLFLKHIDITKPNSK